MKKELVVPILFLISILAISLASSAVKDETACDYDPKYDKDEDFVMDWKADCPEGYEYDCDDGDKDVYKDCEDSFWKRLVDWLKGGGKGGSIISSNAVKMIPDEAAAKEHIARVQHGPVKDSAPEEGVSCSPVTICKEDFRDVYCPLEFGECCRRYDDCRSVECADEFCMDETVYEDSYEDDSYDYAYDDGEDYYGDLDSGCDEEYHDCYDGDEAIICKGSFDACDANFQGCICGTEDELEDDVLQPDFDNSAPVDCDTGIFVCRRQTITMSGDIADSTVTCKESFARCSLIYGDCECGDSSLTDFPTQYVGADSGIGAMIDNAENLKCDFLGRSIPCYMLPSGDCDEKQNTCDRGDGIWISCSGSFAYCNRTFSGKCLCGVENLGYGEMVTSAD